jgi:hypothetical protein
MNHTQKTTTKRNETSTSTIKAPDSKMSSPKISRSSTDNIGQMGATRSQPSHEEIAARAYQIYIERGGTNGNDQDDWLQAERELAGRR